MKKMIYLLLISFQIGLICLILFNVSYKKSQTKVVSVNPIKKEDVVSSSSSGLKYFYELKANSVIKDYLPGFSDVNTINSDTLNERYDYSINKPNRTFRIITLGDSFTYGLHVDTKDNWTELLEDMLNSNLKCKNIDKFEVINLGVPGYDTAYAVERYRIRGQKYNPDSIIWYIVDFMRIDEEFMGKFQIESQLIMNNKQLSQDSKIELRNKAFTDSYHTLGKLNAKTKIKYQQNAINTFNKYYKGPLIMVTNPKMEKNSKDYLKTISDKYNYYYLNNLTHFEKENGIFENDLHPNNKGHQIIAKDMFNYLSNSNIINCEK